MKKPDQTQSEQTPIAADSADSRQEYHAPELMDMGKTGDLIQTGISSSGSDAAYS